MGFYEFFSIALGVTIVVQGLVNREMATVWGLGSAVMINAVIFTLLCLGFYFIAQYTPHLVPEFIRTKSSDLPFKWYYTLPGICGFLIVAGVPWAIQNIGAAKCLILVIGAQVIVSLLYDSWQTDARLNWMKLAGGVLTMAGSALVILA